MNYYNEENDYLIQNPNIKKFTFKTILKKSCKIYLFLSAIALIITLYVFLGEDIAHTIKDITHTQDKKQRIYNEFERAFTHYELKNNDDNLPEKCLNYLNEHPNYKLKKQLSMFLISLFVGTLGVDRFVMGYCCLGTLKLLTFGGCGIWYLVDWILLAANPFDDAHGCPLVDTWS